MPFPLESKFHEDWDFVLKTISTLPTTLPGTEWVLSDMYWTNIWTNGFLLCQGLERFHFVTYSSSTLSFGLSPPFRLACCKMSVLNFFILTHVLLDLISRCWVIFHKELMGSIFPQFFFSYLKYATWWWWWLFCFGRLYYCQQLSTSSFWVGGLSIPIQLTLRGFKKNERTSSIKHVT